MGYSILPLIQGEVVQPLQTLPAAVTTSRPARFAPTLRSGYFYMRDRRYYLPARKVSCWLEELTWYSFRISDQVVPGSERVWLRGIEVTSTPQYRLAGAFLSVNGRALSHPGTLTEELAYDASLLDPMALGDVLDPNDQVRITYDYRDWSSGTKSTSSLSDAVNAGMDFEMKYSGTFGDAWTFVVPAATAAAPSLTIVGTVVTLNNWTAGTTTIQMVLDLLNAAAIPFVATHDGVGVTTALLNALITGLGGAPQTAVFAGGLDSGFTTNTLTEIFPLSQATVGYRFDAMPNLDSPIVITDDRMQDWDRRDISPEFTVSADGHLEFNVPRNYVNNPDFEASRTELSFWMTSGTVTLGVEDLAFTRPRARSASRYAELAASSSLAQVFPVTSLEEHILSVAARGTDPWQVTVVFYDLTWTSLGTATFNPAAPGTDWFKQNYTFGPAGQARTYDYNPPADATWAVVTILVGAGDTIQVDYVHWGQGSREPDHWQPHPHMTVEYDIGETTYEHQPLLAWGPDGKPRANQAPPLPCNTHSVSNVDTTGFLYWREQDGISDFRWGLGGVNKAPSAAAHSDFYVDTPEPNADGTAILPDGEGGFFIGGLFTTLDGATAAGLAHILPDGTVDPNFTVSITGVLARVQAMVLIGTTLYIGGVFTGVNGSARANLAAVDMTGTLTSWDPGSTVSINGMSVSPDSTTIWVAAGGVGGTIGGSVRDAVAELDLAGVATAFNASAAIAAGAGERVLQIGDVVWVAGSFTTGAGIDYLARFDLTGALDAAFDTLVNTNVNSMTAAAGKLYIGGGFNTVLGSTRNSLARIDLDTDTLDAWNPNVNAAVEEIVIAAGLILITGSFTQVGTSFRTRLAEVDESGAVTDWSPELDAIGLQLAVSDRLVGVVGSFTTVSGEAEPFFMLFPFFDGRVISGRRHVPYYKMDGLGKLRHVSTLRFNAQPWLREVTVVEEAQVPGSLELLQVPGLVREDPGLTLTVPIAPGDTTINATPSSVMIEGVSFVRVVEVPTGTPVKNELFFVKQVLGVNQFVAGHAAVNAFSLSAILLAERPVLRGWIGQKRVVRLKVRDKNGAPLDGVKVSWTVADTTGSVLEVFDRGLLTNQDGEWSCILSLIDGPATSIDFQVGDKIVTLIVRVDTLP